MSLLWLWLLGLLLVEGDMKRAKAGMNPLYNALMAIGLCCEARRRTEPGYAHGALTLRKQHA